MCRLVHACIAYTVVEIFNMASWSTSDVTDFIEIYRSEECLWKVKSPFYSNKLHRQRAYTKLVDFVSTFDKDATKEIVVRKINSLRSSFRKELKKVKSSIVSGSGTDEIYQPRLWYYNAMLFLQDQEETRSSCSSLCTTVEEGVSQCRLLGLLI